MSLSQENFKFLFQENYGKLKAFYRKRGLSPEDCEDLIQNTFVQAFKNRSKFNHLGKPSSWLHKVADNIFNNFYRKTKLQKNEHVKVAFQEEIFAAENEDPAGFLVNEEQAQRIKEIVNRLPKQRRQCILLYYYQGLTYAEVAETLRLKLGTVKSHIHQALAQIKAQIKTSSASGEGS